MKDDDAIPLEPVTDEATEARIVAWVLGEASAFEITELERLCAGKPELEIFRRRMLALQGLLNDTASEADDAEWKLPSGKRERVITTLGGEADQVAEISREKRVSRTGLRVIFGIAACLVVTLVVMRLVSPHAQRKYAQASSPEEMDVAFAAASGGQSKDELKKMVREQEDRVEQQRQQLSQVVRTKGIIYRGGENLEPLKGEKRDATIQRVLDTQDYADAKRGFETELAKLQEMKLRLVTESATAASPEPPMAVAQSDRESSLFTGGVRSGDAVVTRNNIDAILNNPARLKGEKRWEENNELAELVPQARVAPGKGRARIEAPMEAWQDTDHDQLGSDLAGVAKNKSVAAADAPVDGFAMAPAADPAAPAAASGKDEFADRSEMTASRSSAGVGSALGGSRTATDSFAPGTTDAERKALDFLGMGQGAVQDNTPSPAAAPAADPFVADLGDVVKREAMKQMEETPEALLNKAQKPAFDTETIAAEEPFSTFSLNVSDVSFQLAKAALERGERPAPESIKVEQFYNAVDYGDAAPSSGEPVAGVVEQSVHPVIPGRNLIRMGVRTAAAGRSAAQPLRLTLLVDQSGSMVREDRKAAMEKAVAGLGQLLTEADRISVIGFSRTSRLIAEDLPGNKISELGALVNPEASEGGTNLEEALKLSEIIADRHKLEGAQNRVVLFTDGAANLGDADPARLAERVKAMRQAGIAFDVAGIGAEDLNDRVLAELARNGNGRYYVVADNLAAQLAGAFRPAAEDVKVQVRFNPQRVAGYRLVGFEESRLKTEDFRNDAIDAAELAAEEAAVALYQVEVLPGGTGEIGEMSVRFREAGTGNTVERSWTIPYDSATPAFDKATPSMKLAGLSMLAAEKLKGGPLADAINFRELAGPLADARRYYKDSNEVAEMARVIGLLAK